MWRKYAITTIVSTTNTTTPITKTVTKHKGRIGTIVTGPIVTGTNNLFCWITVGILLCGFHIIGTTNAVDAASSSESSTVSPSFFRSSLPNCTLVRSSLESRGLNGVDIPKEALNDVTLHYCETPKGTCCTHMIEAKLAASSRIQLDKNTKESIGKLASVLGTRATKFNDFFKELLAQSKKEFHDMFKRTYGVIYEQNSYVFSDLFTELENYYTRGKVDLSEELDTFFNILYQKMFTVLNSQYTFDDKYLGCVSEHMKELKPFGDVPDKLSVQIKRSFVATRTYEQALAAAAEVARNMINVRPNAECTAALTKMQQCGLCNGYAEKPCSNYCVNVMKGCLHYYNEMDVEWDNFVASMEKVSERLLGPFNIVMVVEPINIKISEAIMNFQETGHDISQQVFQGCGRPQLGRRRRSIGTNLYRLGERSMKVAINDTDSFTFSDEPLTRNRRATGSESSANRELQFESLKFSNSEEVSEENDKTDMRKNRKKQKQASNKKRKDEEDSKEPHMDKLVKDIRQKVKDSKKFWSNLPFQICNYEDFSASPSADGNCWNGHAVDRYTHSIVTEGHSNPEFTLLSSGTRQSSLIAGQLFTLRNAVGHLRNAYNGLDVEWSDVDEPYYGSGSGSGAGIDDEDDDTGSGISSYDFNSRAPDHTDHINKIGINTASDPSQSSTSAPPIQTDDKPPPNSSSGSNGLTKLPQMSVRRALFTYLFPIYMAWFGGLFCDLL